MLKKAWIVYAVQAFFVVIYFSTWHSDMEAGTFCCFEMLFFKLSFNQIIPHATFHYS